MRILVTGGEGFIGSHVVADLLKAGHEVTVYDSLEYGHLGYNCHHAVRSVVGSLVAQNNLTSILTDMQCVIHLAAKGNVVESILDPIANFHVNVTGTTNLLEAMRNSKTRHIIFASTGGALMGNASPPINEETSPAPISPYGASKAACEHYIRAFSTSYEITHTIYRFGNVLGENCKHKKGVVNKFYEEASRGNPLVVFGDVSRDFIDVDDISKTLVNNITNEKSVNETFQLAMGRETSITEIAKIVLAEMGKPDHLINTMSARHGEVSRVFSNTEKAFRVLGFNANTNINGLVSRVIQYLKKL